MKRKKIIVGTMAAILASSTIGGCSDSKFDPAKNIPEPVYGPPQANMQDNSKADFEAQK